MEAELKRDGSLDEGENLEISCVRRTNKIAKKSICKEMLELFAYIVGYTDEFPRQIITKDSKMVDRAKMQVNETHMNITDKMRLVELMNIVGELKFRIDSVMEENKARDNRVKELEKEVENLKRQTTTAENPSHNKTSVPAITPAVEAERNDGNEEQGEVSEVRNDASNADGDDNDDSSSSDNSSDSDDTVIHCAQRSPKSQRSPKTQRKAAYRTVMDENGIAWMTQIYKISTKSQGSSQIDPVQSQSGEPRPNPEPSRSRTDPPRSQPGPSRSQTGTSDPQAGPSTSVDPSSKSSRQQPARSYGEALKYGKPAVAAPKAPARAPMRKNTNLRGITQERGVALYLKNIAVTDESNDEIEELVRDYARNKGIRVMGLHVIRFKTYTDAVGCKISVPVNRRSTQTCGPATSPAVDGNGLTCG
jgi:hypothetical protein